MSSSFFSSLVSSTVDYLQDQTKKATIPPRICAHCNRKVYRAKLYVGADTICNCAICNEEVCGNCADKSKNKIPSHLLFNSSINKPNSSDKISSSDQLSSTSNVVVASIASDDKKVDSTVPAIIVNDIAEAKDSKDTKENKDSKEETIKNWLCNKCKVECDKVWLKEFQTSIHEKYDDIVDTYFNNDGRYQVFFKFPSVKDDNTKRKVLRAVQVAEYGFSITGYDAIFKVAKYAYYGREIYNTLLKAEMLSVMKPIIENLKIYGVKTDDYMTPLYLYYLSCKHQTLFNKNPDYESRGHKANDPGIIQENCPKNLLDYAGKYLGAAQLLYIAYLPEPHNTNEWSTWYLTKLTSRQKISVILCQNETSLLPDGKKCPAFAMLAKNNDNNEKEVQLIIRGTHQVMDWSINLNEDPVLFQYAYGNAQNGSNIEMLEGSIHKGMYEGAIGILDDYCCYEYLLLFLSNGYKLKIIGHSLGAGTASIIAAILKTRLFTNNLELFHNADVRAIVFATPPVMSEELATAVGRDELVLSIILGLDCVPRFSKKNLADIAKELSEFIPQAKKWYDQDYADVSAYVKSFGKASDPFSKSEEASDGKEFEENIKQAVDVGTNIASSVQNAWVSGNVSDLTGVFVDAKPIDEPIKPRDIPILKLVSPGTLVHIYRDQNRFKASVCDYKLPTFSKLDLLFTRGFDDHKMHSHWVAMRTLRHANYDGDIKDHHDNIKNYSETKTDDSNSNSKNCSVCGLDVSWAYITHSDASISQTSHNCAICKRTVCSICAPAGDIFKGDGIQASVSLADRRIVIPSVILEPQRVCAHCYLDSYDII